MLAVCSGALAYWTLAPLTRSARSDSSYPDLPGRAETGRTRPAHVAHQLKRGFEAALRLAGPTVALGRLG